MAAGRGVDGRRVADLPLIPTTVIGSYPQPSWLIDHDLLVEKGVPRTEAAEVWRIAPDELDDALDAATVPGPFTLSQLAQNEHYPDQRSLAFAYADAIQEELTDLVAAGIDVVQLDEPYLQANAEAARRFAVQAIDRAFAGIEATTVLHT